MKLSYNPNTHRRCIVCQNNGQPPLRAIVGIAPEPNPAQAPLLECGHCDANMEDFKELHPDWWWDE
jgi:hypothetical protein